jgi:hypothetical protein
LVGGIWHAAQAYSRVKMRVIDYLARQLRRGKKASVRRE